MYYALKLLHQKSCLFLDICSYCYNWLQRKKWKKNRQTIKKDNWNFKWNKKCLKNERKKKENKNKKKEKKRVT